MEGKSGQEICFPPQPFNGLSISYAVKEGIIEIADFVTHIAALHSLATQRIGMVDTTRLVHGKTPRTPLRACLVV